MLFKSQVPGTKVERFAAGKQHCRGAQVWEKQITRRRIHTTEEDLCPDAPGLPEAKPISTAIRGFMVLVKARVGS